MPPPMRSRSALSSRLSMTPSLSETFEPPSTTTYGPLRVVGQPPQHLDLGRDQAARRRAAAAARRRRRWRACGARRRSRRSTKTSAERGELVGERAALGVVLAGLARRRSGRSPAARPRRPPGRRPSTGRDSPDGVGGEGDRRCRAARRAARPTGASEYAGSGVALGPAQVRGHDHPGAGVAQRVDRRQAGADPAVVGDRCCRRAGR